MVNASVVPPIGERIRQERLRKGVSARALAREIGVSASLISQIETEKSQPSVSTLYAITTALGISVEDIFAQVPAEPAASVSAPASAPASAPETISALQALGAARRRIGPVVRAAEREVLTLDSGVTWELLGQVPDVHTDFLRITYQPGGSSSSSAGLLMRHSGTEYGHVLSGELVLTLGFDEHHLAAGDSVSFDSTTPHSYRNDGAEPAVGIWFVLEQ
ncbi:cupin domain-containing protein [Jiangella alkaliphila]|uniref:Transcriptional regulator, contains XRE-family HTH domain n=1 Tax=Jiangella alkaliphila TaxID=419479 RepID=A0A1H2LHE7_9ACTN|nr:cupin domain-containing protein [Jiangella alkaliphila]SDU80457.1 Transcriptional regulator, contains XRE-family HTH domain [Jiangella alkaliphila]